MFWIKTVLCAFFVNQILQHVTLNNMTEAKHNQDRTLASISTQLDSLRTEIDRNREQTVFINNQIEHIYLRMSANENN